MLLKLQAWTAGLTLAWAAPLHIGATLVMTCITLCQGVCTCRLLELQAHAAGLASALTAPPCNIQHKNAQAEGIAPSQSYTSRLLELLAYAAGLTSALAASPCSTSAMLALSRFASVVRAPCRSTVLALIASHCLGICSWSHICPSSITLKHISADNLA